MSITVTLPDGKPLDLPDGATGADAAAAIGPGLARVALAIEVSEPTAGESGAVAREIRDLARPLPDGACVSILTKTSGDASLELIRHDAAHVLASAVMELYPGVKISIGPPIEQGFYYDFEFPDRTSVSEEQFEEIEQRMRAHVRAAEPFEREDVTPQHARERFAAEGQDYKVELIDDLVTAARARGEELQTVSLYTNGSFTDLCRGPHSPSTANVAAFKLQSVAGAYWRGDSSRTMLTRIYGTAFHSKAALAEHLERLERARARDHRKLGRELGLFDFSEVSPGAAFWLPAGTRLWNRLVTISREMGDARGYTEVKTPLIYDAQLWQTSGHWGKYRENMYLLDLDGPESAAVKPMNCPGHAHLYGMRRHSYRELPVRYSEPGLLHRNEASGVLHGLLRVRHFAQDDAHIFCADEQVQAEVAGCLEMAFATYALFDLDVRLELSTRPAQRIGDDAMWDRAEGALTQALAQRGLAYELNPGDGAFYGPKVDMHMTDSLGRSWQLGTVQLDYSMPERFGLTYTGADNAEHTPVMIHRALFGSYERFIGIMLEHYGGELPVWLAPTTAIVLTIADRFDAYAQGVAERLRALGAFVEVDGRSESIARKVREAELRKIPYMLIVGEREAAEDTVSVRAHHGEDLGAVAVAGFGERLRGELYSAALHEPSSDQSPHTATPKGP
jgi:threonyl-tRNA synthetase